MTKVCTHPDFGSEFCPLCAQESPLKEMRELVDELEDYSISPHIDYSTEGVSALQDAMLKSRSYSERASAIYSKLLHLRGRIYLNHRIIKVKHQVEYDSVVENLVRRYGDLSWEERASIFRLKCLDWESSFHSSENYLNEANTIVEQGDVLARSLYRARNDLSAIAQVMRFGESLKEF